MKALYNLQNCLLLLKLQGLPYRGLSNIYIHTDINVGMEGFTGGSVVKNPPDNEGLRVDPGSGRPSREGNGNPLQYAELGNPTD